VTYRQYGGICWEELEKIDMKLNVMKLQVVRTVRSHSKAVNDVVIGDNGDKSIGYVDELKYLEWYIFVSKCVLYYFASYTNSLFPVF